MGAERKSEIGGGAWPWTAELNVAVGITSVLLCFLSGMVLGLWSFAGPLPVPGQLGDYGELPRRLIRLGHIAFFGLGILNIVLARNIVSMALDSRARAFALCAMNLGNLLMPALLFTAAFLPVAKYMLALPATAVTAAYMVAVTGCWRGWHRGSPQRGV